MRRGFMYTVLSGIAFLLVIAPMLGCDGNDDETASDPTPDDKVTFTIGNHTDLTGVSSQAMGVINLALADMIKYYNENDLIPGIELDVITWDGQYDPSRDLPGYEWLIERSADAIFSPVAGTAITLKPRLKQDGMVLFSVAPPPEAIHPPDWVFAVAQTLIDYEVYTLLAWTAENDPDFPKDRPAKVGAAFWDEAYGESCLRAAQTYIEAHPETYEWGGGYLTQIGSFTWGPEVQALKDCDYVLPPLPMTNFVREYREVGYTAKFLGTDAHVAFLGLLDDAGAWDEADDMLLIRVCQWWTDEGAVIDLTKQLLQENHAKTAERIIRTGNGYLATQQIYLMFSLLQHTVAQVGPEDLDSPAIFESAQSFSMVLDGCPHSFSENKRTSNDALAVYQIDGTRKDVFRADPEWIPIVYQP